MVNIETDRNGAGATTLRARRQNKNIETGAKDATVSSYTFGNDASHLAYGSSEREEVPTLRVMQRNKFQEMQDLVDNQQRTQTEPLRDMYANDVDTYGVRSVHQNEFGGPFEESMLGGKDDVFIGIGDTREMRETGNLGDLGHDVHATQAGVW
jgi:hypothetical protein